MIRCHVEVIERHLEKKGTECRATPALATRRLSFDELLLRDEARWWLIGCPEDLRRIAERSQRELRAGEFQRFVAWMTTNLGVALARAAGLPLGSLGRPRLGFAV